MHVMIPFASALDPQVAGILRELELPRLSRLLGLLTPTGNVGDADETSPFPRTNSSSPASVASTTPGRRPLPGACARPAKARTMPRGRC